MGALGLALEDQCCVFEFKRSNRGESAIRGVWTKNPFKLGVESPMHKGKGMRVLVLLSFQFHSIWYASVPLLASSWPKNALSRQRRRTNPEPHPNATIVFLSLPSFYFACPSLSKSTMNIQFILNSKEPKLFKRKLNVIRGELKQPTIGDLSPLSILYILVSRLKRKKEKWKKSPTYRIEVHPGKLWRILKMEMKREDQRKKTMYHFELFNFFAIISSSSPQLVCRIWIMLLLVMWGECRECG